MPLVSYVISLVFLVLVIKVLERKQPSGCQRKEHLMEILNVRTLHVCRKVRELTNEIKRYRWDILNLADVRKTGFGETTTGEGCKI